MRKDVRRHAGLEFHKNTISGRVFSVFGFVLIFLAEKGLAAPRFKKRFATSLCISGIDITAPVRFF
jgi:hypothetical protein